MVINTCLYYVSLLDRANITVLWSDVVIYRNNEKLKDHYAESTTVITNWLWWVWVMTFFKIFYLDQSYRNLHEPTANLSKHQTGVLYMGIKIYNSLPAYIKHEFNNYKKFESLLKKFLCENSFYLLEEFFSFPKFVINIKLIMEDISYIAIVSLYSICIFLTSSISYGFVDHIWIYRVYNNTNKQPFNVEHIINQPMKAPCKHRTSHKMKCVCIYIYIYRKKSSTQIHTCNM